MDIDSQIEAFFPVELRSRSRRRRSRVLLALALALIIGAALVFIIGSAAAG